MAYSRIYIYIYVYINVYIIIYLYLNERWYVYNIFTTNHKWLVVNLNLTLRLLFCPTITTSNNMSLKICCKNIVKILWTYNFYIYIYIYIKTRDFFFYLNNGPITMFANAIIGQNSKFKTNLPPLTLSIPCLPVASSDFFFLLLFFSFFLFLPYLHSSIFLLFSLFFSFFHSSFTTHLDLFFSLPLHFDFPLFYLWWC